MAQQDPQRLAEHVYWVNQTGSTQDLARSLQDTFAHGDMIATDYQTAGRGRLDRSWDTPAGTAAAMSVFLRPHLPSELLGSVTLVVADALVRWFRELGVGAGVKWPNDVQGPDGRKLCGILAQWLPETQTVVAGIGVNLDFGGAAQLETAAALADYGVKFSAREFVVECQQRLVAAVDAFADSPTLKPFEATMTTIGQQVKAVMPGGQHIYGTAVGLGPTGSLLIQAETLQEVFAADIIHLRRV